MNRTPVRRRQRLREITGDVKCKRVDIQELAEMSEDGFERMVQRVTVMVQHKKVQAEAATAALKLQPSSMDWLCAGIRKLCEKPKALCWTLEGESEKPKDDRAEYPRGKVKEAQQAKKKEMRKAREGAANDRCPVTQHVAVNREKAEAGEEQAMALQ